MGHEIKDEFDIAQKTIALELFQKVKDGFINMAE
jgi:hypothetical protein